jgi:hypothetical protein
MIKREKQKVKIDFKLGDEFLDLRTMDTNVIIEKLEENMKIREMNIKKFIEKEVKKT